MSRRLYPGLVLMVFIAAGLAGFQQPQPGNEWTGKKAVKWFNAREWLSGLHLHPHQSVNKEEFAKQYHADKIRWDKAFAFLRDNDLVRLKPGKYPIDGDNVFATVTEAPSKEFEKSRWESHRNYQDIQYVISGKEKIGVAPVSSATVSQAYDNTKDLAFYNAEGRYYTAKPGAFFIFFPGDAHRPNIKVKGYDVVKKIVIKVRRAT